MDNLRKVIELLFCQISPKEVICKWLQEDRFDYTNDIPQNVFVNKFEALHTEKNQDEINAIYHLAFSDWNKLPETFSPLGYNNQSNVFFILVKFLREILCELSELPVCHFQYLFRWRDISLKIGEDILTTSFFAYKDIVGERDRHFFSWPSVVSTDNLPLSEILSKGVTDLHFHLIGSSLNFDIGWISLMNNIKYRKDDFKKLLYLRYPNTTISQEDRNNWSLYTLAVKACAIRQFLFRLIIKEYNDKQSDWEMYKKILLCDTEDEISMFVSEIQDENERLRFSYGKYYSGSVADYAINRAISAKNESDLYFHNTILYGERWMLYKMFRYIFHGNRNDKNTFRPLFYVYLLIKTRIRNEFVQVNNYLGFQNFKDYQDRKVLFIKSGSVYEKLLVNLAIKNSIISQNVSYLEVRIPPNNTTNENIRILKFLDKCANDSFDELLNFTTTFNEQPCFYYIFHFLKHDDKWNDDSLDFLFQPRHFHLRKKIKEQAFAINSLRKQYGNTKDRIVGIDAAGAEIGCRPEVFSQAYRYLKKYSCELEQHFLENKSLNSLGFTYHVGEDFMDIADGLRAIDEAIIFLNLRSGDRLGHCLALGVSPEKYYKQKNYHIIISKQDLLDNIVWLLMQIQIYDIPCSQSLLLELRQRYFELYADIYCLNSSVVKLDNKFDEQFPQFTPYHIYYLSWLLRGDDPCLYKDKSNNYQSYTAFKYWDMCGENRFTEQLSSARSNEKVRTLYHRYHYDAHVRSNGTKPFEFKISKDYIQLINKIQNRMMIDISQKQIAIECNPTSNKLIGGFEFYSDLPLKRFFNLGLTYNHDELSRCPQISSSINTDDLGIFSTSISNEYALMALAIEKMKNEDGTKQYNTRMVYDWLERIRVMGFEQRFKK